MPERQRFAKDKGRLRHRTFLGIDQQKHALNHAKRPFHFAAEVGMSGGVDDVDLDAFISDAGVLGADGDAAFTLLIHRIHNTLAHVLDLPVDVRLPQHGINQRCFAVIDVRNDGNVSNVGPLTKRRAPDFLNGVGRQMCVHTLYLLETKKKTPTDAASSGSISHGASNYKRIKYATPDGTTACLEFWSLSL